VADEYLSEPVFRFIEALATVPVWPGIYIGLMTGYVLIVDEPEGMGYLMAATVLSLMFCGVILVGVVVVTSILRTRAGSSSTSPNRIDVGLIGCYCLGWGMVIASGIISGGSLPRTGPGETVVLTRFGLGRVSVAVLSIVIVGRFGKLVFDGLKKRV